MFRALRVLVLIVTLAILPQPGHAGPVGWSLSIMPVASTRIESHREQRLMLCKIVPSLRVLSLPLWPGKPEYALAAQCQGADRISPISSERLAAAVNASLIPDAVHPHARRTLADWLSGTWGWTFFAAFGALLSLMQKGRRRVARFANMPL